MHGEAFDVLGVRIDDVSSERLKELLEQFFVSERPRLIVTPNPEFVLQAEKDAVFASLLATSDLALPDGVGLRFAVCALTPHRLEHRHAGVDVLVRLAELCRDRGDRMALVGGVAGSATETADVLRSQFFGLEVLGINPGEIDGDSERVLIPLDLISVLNTFAPRVLAVGLGQGKQERAIITLFKQVPSLKIGIGTGGSFDTLSGRFPRAPLFFRKTGLEWLWRLRLQPSRIQRIFRAVFVFPSHVVIASLRSRQFFRACGRVFPEVFSQLRGQ